MTTPTSLSRPALGTAPDSWGVWFPQDAHQVTWRQYLDADAIHRRMRDKLTPELARIS
jgi:hypothetical protein